jgi:hypothetical protein
VSGHLCAARHMLTLVGAQRPVAPPVGSGPAGSP